VLAKPQPDVEEARESPADEASRLRRCLNDLLGIMALPALWAGGGSLAIANTLMDALAGTLPTTFVYVRLNRPDGDRYTEMARLASPLDGVNGPEGLGRLLNASLGEAPHRWPEHALLSVRGGGLQAASARLGADGELGIVVVGSPQTDFPRQTERLVLDVATNQAAIGLQQEWKLLEQQSVARELDERVARRTGELAAANERLKNRERELKLIIDSIPGFICLLTPSGGLDLVNGQALQYFGQTIEQLREWQTNDTVHPADLPHVAEVFSRSIATGAPFEITQRFKRRDGVYRWFQNSGHPLRDASGNIVRWYLLLTDIDDRKRAEDVVRASERELKLIIDTIPAFVWCMLPDGSNDFISKGWHEFTGVTPEEARGWGWQAVFHPDDLPALMKKWAEVLAAGKPDEIESRLRRRDGVYRWFLIRASPFRDSAGNIVRWYGTSTDIEDRKRAEEELRLKEAFLARAQLLSLSGCFSRSVDTNEVTFSEGARRIFGFDSDSPVTLEKIAARVHPDDRALLTERVGGTRGSGGDQNYSIRLQLPDGAVKHLRASSQETLDAQGRREYVGAIQDVTEQHLAEQALDKARSELARVTRLTSLSALTASIAHEINQPLAGIITNAGTCLRMLNADPPNVEGARETARRTIRDGNRASDVIVRLRALFSKREFIAEPLDLNEAAKEVIALSWNDLERNQVVVQTQFAEDLPPVTGDRVQLQQVILNLLRNACDAMVGVQDRPRRLWIRSEHRGDGHVHLIVRDSGVGLAGQNVEKLFDSFYTTKSGGMGIGLSLSRSIIERHQGRLWAETNEEPGATFCFTIPCQPA
jgi:PAS domain S-box-containing protein